MLNRLLCGAFLFISLLGFVEAEECSNIFTGGMQNNHVDGEITFNWDGKITNNPSNEIDSQNSIIYGSAQNTCVTEQCISSGNIASSFTISDFGTGVDGDISLDASDGAQTKSPGEYTSLSLEYNADLTLEAGDYYFTGDFTNDSQNNIAISGDSTAVVRIFVQGNVALGFASGINETGDSSQLLLYSSSTISIGNAANVSGFIYSNNDATLDYASVVNGAVNAKNITAIGTAVRVNYPDTIPDICDVTDPEPELGYCDTTFVNGATSWSDNQNGTITFEGDPTIYNDKNGVLQTKEIDGDNDDSLTCNDNVDGSADRQCTASGSDTQQLDIGDYISQSNGTNANNITGAITLGEDDGYVTNNFKNIKVNDGGNVTFSSNYQIYYIETLEVLKNNSSDSATINFAPGEYHIGTFTAEGNTEINITSPGEVRIIIAKSSSFTDNVRANIGGDPEDFLIYSEDDFSIEDTTEVHGLIYTENNADLRDSAKLVGAISSRSVRLRDNSEIYYTCDANTAPTLPEIEMVAGRVTLEQTSDTGEFTHVCFDTPFSETPLIFSLPTTVSNSDRLTLRIKNVTTEGFDIAQLESRESANPNAPDGNISQTVDFLAIVPGDYDLENDAKMRVSSINTQSYQGRRFSSTSWEDVDISDLSFPQNPTIIASIQTMANEDKNHPNGPFPISEPFMATTIQGVSANGFEIALERGETNTGIIDVDETIGYIAITSGASGQLTEDITFEANRTDNNVRGINTCRNVNFNNSYLDNPLVIGSQNTRAGTDGGWLKRCNISLTNVGFSIVEDGDQDMDTNHINETAGYIALGGTFKDFTNTCSILIDHFEIDTKNAMGLTCEPDTITINACSDASCSVPYADAVDVILSVSDASGVVLNKDFTVVGGTTDVNYIHTTAEVVSLSLDQTYECSNGDPTPCTVSFANAGFKFTSGTSGNENLPVQLSGKPSNIGYNADTLQIEAVQDDGTGACAPLLVTGQSIDMAASYQTPTTGTHDVNISGVAIGTANNGTAFDSLPFVAVPLDFGGDTQSSAEFIFTYADAGSVILNARYELPDDDGNPSGEFIQDSSEPITIRPFAFDLFVDKNIDVGDSEYVANPGAINSSGDVFTVAADEIRITTRAVAWKSGDDDNANGIADEGEDLTNISNNPTTNNFTDIVLSSLSHNKIQPSAGIADGDLSVSSGTFSDGVQEDIASYDEVGIISLEANYTNYLNSGESIQGTAPYVGRFTPDHFSVTILNDGEIWSTCDTTSSSTSLPFAYSGQMLLTTDLLGYSTTKGALGFGATTDSVPNITIEARNKDNELTQNYVDDFMMLTIDSFARESAPAGGIEIFAPYEDAVQVGEDLTNNLRIDTLLSEGNFTNANGVITYNYDDDDNFVYVHEENSEVIEFPADIDLPMVSIIDGDGIATVDYDNVLPDDGFIFTLNPTAPDIRFGRAQLKNSYGPDTSDLPQKLSINYFTEDGYKLSETDTCTTFDSDNITLTEITLDPALTPIKEAVTGTFSDEFPFGETHDIILTAPTTGTVSNTGQVCVSYAVFPWLQYQWAIDEDNLQCAYETIDVDGFFNDNPHAVATFGLYRGNDRVIYQREISR